ncbi:MAG: DUF1934 domain-containing protein [Clostridia bacterium]|nr:DUF1934 domain-containing protein [Clostridia bacterium]
MAIETRMTEERDVRVHVRSLQYDYRESLSERIKKMREAAEELLEALEEAGVPCDGDEGEDLYDAAACGDAGEPFEMVTEGRLRVKGNLCELSYMETGAEGLEDTRTTLVFSRNRPSILTLTRTGMMKMTLSFEEGRHHIGDYHIGALQSLFSDGKRGLSIASYARRVENKLLTSGTLELDYIIEVRGMDTQRTVFSLSISDLPLVPNGFSGGTTDCSPDGEGVIQ